MKIEDPAASGKPSPSPANPSLKIPASMILPCLSTATAGVSEPPTPSPGRYGRLINSNHHSCPSRPVYSDRFIPSRTGSNFSLFHIPPSPPATSGAGRQEESPSRAYAALLRATLLGPEFGAVSPMTPGKGFGLGFATPPNRNIFRFKTETRRAIETSSPFGTDDSVPGISYSPAKIQRKVSRTPYRVLDAPSLQDDYYLNLVDWSSNNVLAVGLANCVYMWNACSSKVTKLCDLGMDETVCSVGWAQRGANIAVGTSSGKVQIWDVSRCKMIRTMDGHRLRVGSLAWSSSMLSSGSRDKKILHRDIRSQDDYVSKLTGHKSEVCGLKWSYDNRELASGGNDNRLLVWNQHSRQPVLKYCEHTAAVKAIAWSPHLYGLLASGGGTADRCIRFWNTNTSAHLACVDTGSQVCNLAWSKNVNEIVSTHGYSQNQIVVWKYPTMTKLATLTGHSFRVLYLAVSPDGQTIVTGAGDETLRFWNVFPSPKSQNTHRDFGASSGRTQIR